MFLIKLLRWNDGASLEVHTLLLFYLECLILKDKLHIFRTPVGLQIETQILVGIYCRKMQMIITEPRALTAWKSLSDNKSCWSSTRAWEQTENHVLTDPCVSLSPDREITSVITYWDCRIFVWEWNNFYYMRQHYPMDRYCHNPIIAKPDITSPLLHCLVQNIFTFNQQHPLFPNLSYGAGSATWAHLSRTFHWFHTEYKPESCAIISFCHR